MSSSKMKMVQSAASLIGVRGLSGTSYSDVLEASGAPRGSIYHYFPEGKAELAAAAIRWSADKAFANQRACPAETPEDVLNCFLGMWRTTVVESHGSTGCVVAGAAVDVIASQHDLLEVIRMTFRGWVDLISERLQGVGVPVERAYPIAVATLAGLEGALLLCRAEASVEPLDLVRAELLRLLPN